MYIKEYFDKFRQKRNSKSASDLEDTVMKKLLLVALEKSLSALKIALHELIKFN